MNNLNRDHDKIPWTHQQPAQPPSYVIQPPLQFLTIDDPCAESSSTQSSQHFGNSGFDAFGNDECVDHPSQNWMLGGEVQDSMMTMPFCLLTPEGSSVYTEEGTGSRVMVNHRSCSGNSNITSASRSAGRALSVPEPDSMEWPQTSSGSFDPGIVSQTESLHRPSHHGSVIPDLVSPEPQTVLDPYLQPQERGFGANLRTQVSDNFFYQRTNHPPFSMGFPPSIQMEQGPWTPVQPRIDFEPGYVAFVPPPGPAGQQDAEVLRYGMTSSSTQDSKLQSRQTILQPKKVTGRKEPPFLGETKQDSNGPFQYVFVDGNEAPKSRSGVRNGQLDPKIRANAKRVRRKGACWNCWLQKTNCDDEKICHRCKKNFAPGALQVCSRAGFSDYVPAFFPDYHIAHLNSTQVIEFINEHTVNFNGNAINIEVSTGEVFSYMTLQVHVFQPKTDKVLQQTILMDGKTNSENQLITQACAPVGLIGVSPPELMSTCNKHIEEMIQNPAYAEQTTAGDDTELACTMLGIVQQYSIQKNSPLVREALKLHAIHYFMRMLVTLSDSSARAVYPFMQSFSSGAEPGQFLSSRLLNRQLKHIMHKLHKIILTKVLEHLEKAMKLRGKEEWGCCFCAILILSLCIEDLQTAIGTFVLADTESRDSESRYNRVVETCKELEDHPFEQPKRLFHEIYKSRRGGNGLRESGFNPLQATCVGLNTGLDPPTDRMVKSMYDMISSSWDEIVSHSERRLTDGLGAGVKLNETRKRWTGRLTGRFLRSFFHDV